MTCTRLLIVSAALFVMGCLESAPSSDVSDMGVQVDLQCSECVDSGAPDAGGNEADAGPPLDLGDALEARVAGPSTQDVGRTVSFSATDMGADLVGIWSVSDESVLQIDTATGDGTVVGRGTTDIFFESTDGEYRGRTSFSGTFDIVEVSNGRRHQCIRTSHDFVHCSGEGDQGQLGNGTQPNGVAFEIQSTGDLRFDSLDSSEHVTCGILGGNILRCWGDGSNAANGSSVDDVDRPAVVLEGRPIQKVSVGDKFGCILFGNATLQCWGANDAGQLGPTAVSEPNSLVLKPIPFDKDVIDVDLGEHHACVLLKDGEAYCWGSNANKQIHDSLIVEFATPQLISDGPFVSIVAGDQHSCALDADGTAYCWGQANRVGTDLEGIGHEAPAPVSANFKFRKLVSDSDHTCGIVESSSEMIACWGGGEQNELGTTQHGSLVPIRVELLNSKKIVDISTHRFATCLVFDDGSVECVGGAQYGALGRDLPADESNEFTEVWYPQRM